MKHLMLCNHFITEYSANKGEIGQSNFWSDQDFDIDLSIWAWNKESKVYLKSLIVDENLCELTTKETERWQEGKIKAYLLESSAKVYDLIQRTNPIKDI